MKRHKRAEVTVKGRAQLKRWSQLPVVAIVVVQPASHTFHFNLTGKIFPRCVTVYPFLLCGWRGAGLGAVHTTRCILTKLQTITLNVFLRGLQCRAGLGNCHYCKNSPTKMGVFHVGLNTYEDMKIGHIIFYIWLYTPFKVQVPFLFSHTLRVLIPKADTSHLLQLAGTGSRTYFLTWYSFATL